MEYFYGLHSDAIHHATRDGHYPIHDAIRVMTRRVNPAVAIEIVQFLLDCDPNQNLIENLLEYACDSNLTIDSKIEVSIKIIKLIYDAHPETIEYTEIEYDIIRYHQRVQAFINGELVYARQARDLRLMNTPDANGQLPLHRALKNNVRLGSIKLLVKGNPSAIRNADNNFAMPLLIACQHHDSVSVVQYLLGLDRRTLRAVDINNTALHYACRGANHDIIDLLLEKYAASVSKRNADGKLPIDLLWESNAINDRESVEYLGSVFQLLRAYPELLAISSDSKEDETRSSKKRKRDEEV